MTEAIANFFNSIFGDNVILATILIAIVPMIELKGAIPFGMSASFWGDKALSSWAALGFAFLGSILIVPILALVFKPIYEWLKTKKFFNKILDFFVGDVQNRTKKVDEESKNKSQTRALWLKIISVVLFVAFPVPLTGVWTGTCFAVLLGLNFWQTCSSVIFGNAICGIIVTFLCMVFPNATNILLYVFIGVIVVAFVAKLIIHFVKKSKQQTKEGEVNE